MTIIEGPLFLSDAPAGFSFLEHAAGRHGS
jgi:hypothetical protein